MIDTKAEYEITKSQYNRLVGVLTGYKAKLKEDDSLRTKMQYSIFKGQLIELKEELRVYKEMAKFNRLEKSAKKD